MRALFVNAEGNGLVMGDAPPPEPKANQVLIAVSHASLNFGEVNRIRSGAAKPGTVGGWDAAGTVARAASDGSGPDVGSRVVSFASRGGWGEQRAVATHDVAIVPEAVDLATAAALPVAGVAALRALRRSGSLLGRRVLVTGASGGVGRFAVQMATLAGAYVIAAASRTDGLRELGAREVVASPDGLDPVDVVIETVGGPTLVSAWQSLATGGVLQSIGWASREPAVFPPYGTVGPAKSITSFDSGPALGQDLSYLLSLIEQGKLTVEIGWRGSWTDIDQAIDALLGRKVAGKAILELD